MIWERLKAASIDRFAPHCETSIHNGAALTPDSDSAPAYSLRPPARSCQAAFANCSSPRCAEISILVPG